MPKIVIDVDATKYAHYQQQAAKSYRSVPNHIKFLLEQIDGDLSQTVQTVPIAATSLTTPPTIAKESKPVDLNDWTADDLNFDE